MPDFRYRSIDSKGKTVRGVATAFDENSLATLLQDQGQMLIEADLVSGEAKKEQVQATSATQLKKIRVKRAELIRFTYNFHAIVSSGVPIVKGLESLLTEAKEAESPLAEVLLGVIQKLKAGESFSNTLNLYPGAFPSLYVNLVAAGEASGNLEPILIDLAEYLEWSEEIKGNIRQATLYPIIILALVTGLVGLILVYVLPQFTDIFEKLQIPLPLSTQILIFAANLATKYWAYTLAGIIASILALRLIYQHPKGRYLIEYLKSRTPLFGAVIMKIDISRFTKNLSVLNNAGIPLTEALTICQTIASNPELAQGIQMAHEKVTRGEPLATALAASHTIPLLVRNMVAVGEESGKLGDSLARVSRFYDREIKMGLKKAFALLEPMITVFLAVVIGFVAIAIISTLYKAITLVGH